jgi:hypothetical protein
LTDWSIAFLHHPLIPFCLLRLCNCFMSLRWRQWRGPCSGVPNLFLKFFLWHWGLLGGALPLEPLLLPFFVLGILDIGSPELLTQAGFQTRSPWSHRLQTWATGAGPKHFWVSVIISRMTHFLSKVSKHIS